MHSLHGVLSLLALVTHHQFLDVPLKRFRLARYEYPMRSLVRHLQIYFVIAEQPAPHWHRIRPIMHLGQDHFVQVLHPVHQPVMQFALFDDRFGRWH